MNITKMTDTEYFSIEALSQSFLKAWSTDPYRALHIEHKETASQKFGTMVHCYILEPEKFSDRYIVESDIVIDSLKDKYTARTKKETKNIRATTEYKVFVIDAEKTGKILVSKTDAEKMERMAKNFFWYISDNEIEGMSIDDIFKQSQKEMAVFSQSDGIRKKGKIDFYYVAETGIKTVYMFDLKTIADIHDVKKQIDKYKYYWQLQFYRELMQESGYSDYEFVMIEIFLETGFCNYVKAVTICDNYESLALTEIDEAVESFIEYQDSGVELKPFSDSVEICYLPQWRVK